MADVTADEIRGALRRHYGLSASDLGTEEWTLHDEVGIQRFGGITIDMLAIRAWSGKPKGHERHAIEIKISRSDFARELRSGKWRIWAEVVHRFYFAAPAGLIDPGEIPEGCGLLTVDGNGVRRVLTTQHDPMPLDEAVWVELARRASRLAERLRRPASPVEDLAALQITHGRTTARLSKAQDAAGEYRDRLSRLLAGLGIGDVVCSACGLAMTFVRLPSRPGVPRSVWRWQHDADPSRYCAGQPIPRDLYDADELAEESH